MRLPYQPDSNFPAGLPDEYIEGLRIVHDASDETFIKLLSALRNATPAFRPNDLAKQLSSGLDIDEGPLRTVTNTIVALYSLMGILKLSVSEFLERLLQTVKEQTTEEGETFIQDDTDPQFAGRLTQLMEIDGAVTTTSKAIEVQTEHSCIFRGARVLTDIRPVFQSDPTSLPSAAVVVHTLKIDYRQNYDRVTSLYVAMDSADIAALREILARAESKATSAETVLKAAGVTCLKPED